MGTECGEGSVQAATLPGKWNTAHRVGATLDRMEELIVLSRYDGRTVGAGEEGEVSRREAEKKNE
jgi:hypothetical protein